MTKDFFNKFFYFSIILILLGIAFLFVPQEPLRNIFRFVVGILIILVGYYKLVMSNKKALGNREYNLDIIEGFISVFVGVISIRFFNNHIVCFVIGLIYLIIPLLRIFLSTNKINQILMDIFKFIFAGFILMNNSFVPEITKAYISIVFIALGIAILVYRFINHRKNGSDENEELF